MLYRKASKNIAKKSIWSIQRLFYKLRTFCWCITEWQTDFNGMTTRPATSAIWWWWWWFRECLNFHFLCSFFFQNVFWTLFYQLKDNISTVIWYQQGGARGVMVIVDTATRVQILAATDCISHSTNTLGKGMNPVILPPAMVK